MTDINIKMSLFFPAWPDPGLISRGFAVGFSWSCVQVLYHCRALAFAWLFGALSVPRQRDAAAAPEPQRVDQDMMGTGNHRLLSSCPSQQMWIFPQLYACLLGAKNIGLKIFLYFSIVHIVLCMFTGNLSATGNSWPSWSVPDLWSFREQLIITEWWEEHVFPL